MECWHSPRQSEHLVSRDLPAVPRREQRNHLSHGTGVGRPTKRSGILPMCIFNPAPTGQNKSAQGTALGFRTTFTPAQPQTTASPSPP